VDGHAQSDWSRQERAERLAYLPQSVTPAFSFTAEEVILLSRYHRCKQGAEEEMKQLQAAAGVLEIQDLLNCAVNELSGGEWQRVAITRALMQDAQFLLLDEPTAHLDLSHRLALFRYLQQYSSSGKGILCATHDLDAVLEYADRVILLHKGKIESEGRPQEVLTEANMHYVFGEAQVKVLPNPLSQRPQLVIDSREVKERE